MITLVLPLPGGEKNGVILNDTFRGADRYRTWVRVKAGVGVFAPQVTTLP